MFFKDIDSWDKKKLAIVTLIVALCYFLAASVVPCIFIGCNYKVFENVGSYRLTGAGFIIVVILVSFGCKGIKMLIHFLPRDTQKQQIFRYSLELVIALIIPALAIWAIQLFRNNVDLACKTATQCVVSVMVAIVIDNLFFKTLIYQWQCMSEVSHNKKIKRMEQAQQ